MTDGFDPIDYDVTIERTFDVSRERLWNAWTDPDEIEQWLCPAGFTVNFADGDVRPGGGWRSGIRSPDGHTFVLFGEYRGVVEPERLVFTHAWEEGGESDRETVITVTFEPDDSQTRLTFRQEGVISAESQAANEEGWNGVLDNLANHLLASHATLEGSVEGDTQ